MTNEYIPFLSKIKEIVKHTETEYTFRMTYVGEVKPGQFFEVSIPKYGEAPISVSGIGEDYVDLTIRKVGKVTGEIFELNEGSSFFMRGPYGNGFKKENYQGKELIVVAGGTGVSPVRGVISYFGEHPDEVKKLHTILGFKSPSDILFREDLKIWEQQMELILTVDSADDDSYRTGFKSPEDILFRDDLRRWEQQMNLVLTVDSSDDPFYRTGLVTKYIPELELDNIHETAAIVVGPPIMMKFAVAEFFKLGMKEEQIWISQERKMCCGLGKCGHCRMNDTYICLDGPVFCYSEGKKLFD